MRRGRGGKWRRPAFHRGDDCHTHLPAPHLPPPCHKEVLRPAFECVEVLAKLELENHLHLGGGPDDPAASPHLCGAGCCSGYSDVPPSPFPSCARCRCCRGSSRLGFPSCPLRTSRYPSSCSPTTTLLLAPSSPPPPSTRSSSRPPSCSSSLEVQVSRSLEVLAPRLPAGRVPCLSCPGELGEEPPPPPPPHPASPLKRSIGRCPWMSSNAGPHLTKLTSGPAPELSELLLEVLALSSPRSWWWWAGRERTSRASGRAPPHLLPLGRRGREGRRLILV